MKTLVLILLLAAIAAAGATYYVHKTSQPVAQYRTQPVVRQDLVSTIAATGTVEPIEVVDVGAQVEGMIESFGTDPSGRPIDYRSSVNEGTVLARIDDSLYQADFKTATAQLESAKANVEQAKASLTELNAKFHEADRDWTRAQTLANTHALADTLYDTYEATYETAKASVSLGEAQVVQAEKGVIQAQATLDRAKKNLDYCTISSPVQGVIIDRRVTIGETVVSSLNTPSLFLIAKDLTKMQVWTSVNEADIGGIFPDQPATFTVDAFPNRVFKGTVGKVRLNATMTQNVVTYTVEVNTDNSDLALLPYLTAQVEFETGRRTDVLTVPAASLRWTPDESALLPGSPGALALAAANGTGSPSPAGGATGAGGDSTSGRGASGGTGPTTRASGRSGGRRTRSAGLVWAWDGTTLTPYKVRSGLSDGVSTEVEADGLAEGTQIVVGEVQTTAAAPAGSNPFLPTVPRGMGGMGGGGGRGR
jgi:HlyD family secretion protein